MEDLIKVLQSTTLLDESNGVQMFSQFWKKHKHYVGEVLEPFMEQLHVKDEETTQKLKTLANDMYMKQYYEGSLEMNTRALCYAVPLSKTFAQIVANRSAVLFMMKDFESCLKDISYCMDVAEFPKDTLKKVFCRKIKCLVKLNRQDELRSITTEGGVFVDNVDEIIKKEKEVAEATEPSGNETSACEPAVNLSPDEVIPELKDGPNEHFLYASSAVRLSYSEEKGRHVVANKQLEKGDVLFVEKAFVFAPIFVNSYKEFHLDKCYNCLNTSSTCIPCEHCVACVFCNATCRDQAWEEFHRWECRGMQAGLWYHLGITLPALKCIIKGVQSGFEILGTEYDEDSVNYGNAEDNYGYFNKLLSHITDMEDVIPIISMTSLVVAYLRKHTTFFEWLVEQPLCPTKSIRKMSVYVGGLLTRHVAQLQCNSSLVSHKNKNLQKRDVACAIYPSVSMMNHSCISNINMYYIKDTVVVEAAKSIAPDEEIFNCYGVDAQHQSWEERQKHCKSIYFFECNCSACQQKLGNSVR